MIDVSRLLYVCVCAADGYAKNQLALNALWPEKKFQK